MGALLGKTANNPNIAVSEYDLAAARAEVQDGLALFGEELDEFLRQRLGDDAKDPARYDKLGFVEGRKGVMEFESGIRDWLIATGADGGFDGDPSQPAGGDGASSTDEVLERFTSRMIARQRTMYSAPDVPFAEKWRTAIRYLDADREYQKVWFELQALAWNHEGMRNRVRQVLESWVGVLRPAFARGLAELRVDSATLPPDVAVALVATFNQGIILERLSGADSGHGPLLAWIDGGPEPSTVALVAWMRAVVGLMSAEGPAKSRAWVEDQSVVA